MAFGIYVHWPFCAAKCPYCDFNSHVVSNVDQSRWAKALGSELRRYASLTQDNIVSSIYFGGGTPSLMEASTVASVLDVITKEWRLSNDIEITLEANPTSFEAKRFKAYRDAGVNRLSVGVQALNDEDLSALGRLHTASEATHAFEDARNIFPRISLDLIYARQNQTLPQWSDELDRALELAADHLSLYQLTIEDGTAFGARHVAGKLRGLPHEDLAVDLYNLTTARCAEAGFEAYEVSNYARPGAESRHNLVYWRGDAYVGVGPGAHGRIQLDGTWHATEGHKMPGQWVAAAEAGSGDCVNEAIPDLDRAEEQLMMRLRLAEGVPIDWTRRALGKDTLDRLRTLSEEGFIELSSDRFSATSDGRLVLNAVIERLLV